MSNELPGNILPQIIGDNRRDITIATSARWVDRSVFGGDSRCGIWNPHKYSPSFLLVHARPFEFLLLSLPFSFATCTTVTVVEFPTFEPNVPSRSTRIRSRRKMQISQPEVQSPGDLEENREVYRGNATRVVNVRRKMLSSCLMDRNKTSLPVESLFLASRSSSRSFQSFILETRRRKNRLSFKSPRVSCFRVSA